VRRWSSKLERVSSAHGRLVGAGALCGVLALAALAYWWTHAPLYNPTGTIDPWLYTALFVNFDQVYSHFATTYYASRLPWILPGRIVYGVLPVDTAYWVLHGLSFCSGVAALFVLLRRYLGVPAAVVGAATLAITPMYWNAQYWDYIDGVTLTYLLGGLCFGLPLLSGPGRVVCMAAAGVFFAAALTTNLFVAVVAVMYPIAYVFLQPRMAPHQRVVAALKDLSGLLVGAAGLLVALGLYARSNGGPFYFFEPQVNVIRTGTGAFKQPGYDWLRGEPRLLVPVFLLVVAAPLVVLGRRLPPFRFAAASVAGLAYLTTVIYAWEFLAGGNVLELTYYFSYFAIPITLTVASSAALVVALARSHALSEAVAALIAPTAAVVSLGLIFHSDRSEWTGRSGMRIAVVLMGVAVVLTYGAVAARRTRFGFGGAVVALGAVALASHFAINASTGTFVFSHSAPDNRSLYRAALDELAFVKHSTPDNLLPSFWYAAAGHPELVSAQSMYYFGYTYLDLDLPHVTQGLRGNLDLLKPQTIVLLCESRRCGGGLRALRRAGYPYDQGSARLISRGHIRFWVVILRRARGE